MNIIKSIPGYYKFCFDEENNEYIVYIYDFDDKELKYPRIINKFEDEKKAKSYITFMYNVCSDYYNRIYNNKGE